MELFNGGPSITLSTSTVTVNAGNPVAVAITSTGDWGSTSLSATVEVTKGTVRVSNSALALTELPTYPASLTGAAIGFFGPPADVLAALQDDLTWTPAAPTGTGSMTVVVAQYEPGLVFNPANGHFYQEIVSTSAVTWEYASNSAVTLPPKFGMTPYLATITSEAENEFIKTRTGAANVWIGATDDVTFVTQASTSASTNPGEGNWHWATGPEAGEQFWAGDENGVTVSGRYAAWASGEPNNSSGEHCAVTNWQSTFGAWNDLSCTSPTPQRYLVEYGPPTGASGAESASATATLAMAGLTAPTLLAVTGSAGALILEFAPGNDGGVAISGYDFSVDGGISWVSLTNGAITSPLTAGGLAGEVTYPIQIRPRNTYGPGPSSNSLTGTTSAVSLPPPPPTTVPATTTPSSTVAPTTTVPPTTLAPTPVTLPSNDALPDLSAGESVVVRDGLTEVVTTRVEESTDLVVGNDDFELRLRGDCTSGCTIASGANGSQVLELEQDGGVTVAGDGFAPGTPVYVWMFSDPQFVGELTVASDGSFIGTLPLPALEAGTHTLQVNGTSLDGSDRSANLGVLLRPATTAPGSEVTPVQLPSTGTGSAPLLGLALASAILALGTVMTSRRRRLTS